MPHRHEVRVEGSDRTYHRGKILFVILMPLGMALMAVSSVNVALPTIADRLHAGPADLQWILSGYALAFGVCLVPAGRAGDVLGRGPMFLIGLGLFVLGSLACALAPNPGLLNLARLAQGIGAGVFNPQIPGMIQQYFHGPARAKAFALFGMVISVAVAVGPLLTGAIIGWLGPDLGWRGAFLVYLPVGVLALALGWVWLPLERGRARAPRIDLDPVGSALLVAGVLAVMVPFVLRSWPAWLLLLAAAPLGIGWVRWERRYAVRGRDPMVDPGLFTTSSFAYGTSVSGLLLLGQTTTFVVLALYLQGHLGASALDTGLVGLPNALAAAVASVWSGRHVIDRGRSVIVLALSVLLVGTLATIGVAQLVERGASFWWLAMPLLLNGFGMGACNPPNQMLSLLDVPADRAGSAAGAKYTVERVGTAIGNATITGVYFAAAGASWTGGFDAGFAVIALATAAALGVAIQDLRRHPERRGATRGGVP